MTYLCRRPGLAEETKASLFVTQITFANDLQGHRTTQVNVERLVGDPHCPTTQLDRSAVVGGYLSYPNVPPGTARGPAPSRNALRSISTSAWRRYDMYLSLPRSVLGGTKVKKGEPVIAARTSAAARLKVL